MPGLTFILNGCGRYLKSLKFAVPVSPGPRLKLISEQCTSLNNLQLELSHDEKTGTYHTEMRLLMQACTELLRLCIENIDDEFDYSHLEYLPRNILEMHFFALNADPRPTINLSKFQRLEALLLANFDLPENSLNGLETLTNLEYLSFAGSQVHSSNIWKIQNFTKLRHLAISGVDLDDQTLSHIAQKNLDLEFLDISGE